MTTCVLAPTRKRERLSEAATLFPDRGLTVRVHLFLEETQVTCAPEVEVVVPGTSYDFRVVLLEALGAHHAKWCPVPKPHVPPVKFFGVVPAINGNMAVLEVGTEAMATQFLQWAEAVVPGLLRLWVIPAAVFEAPTRVVFFRQQGLWRSLTTPLFVCPGHLLAVEGYLQGNGAGGLGLELRGTLLPSALSLAHSGVGPGDNMQVVSTHTPAADVPPPVPTLRGRAPEPIRVLAPSDPAWKGFLPGLVVTGTCRSPGCVSATLDNPKVWASLQFGSHPMGDVMEPGAVRCHACGGHDTLRVTHEVWLADAVLVAVVPARGDATRRVPVAVLVTATTLEDELVQLPCNPGGLCVGDHVHPWRDVTLVVVPLRNAALFQQAPLCTHPEVAARHALAMGATYRNPLLLWNCHADHLHGAAT